MSGVMRWTGLLGLVWFGVEVSGSRFGDFLLKYGITNECREDCCAGFPRCGAYFRSMYDAELCLESLPPSCHTTLTWSRLLPSKRKWSSYTRWSNTLKIDLSPLEGLWLAAGEYNIHTIYNEGGSRPFNICPFETTNVHISGEKGKTEYAGYGDRAERASRVTRFTMKKSFPIGKAYSKYLSITAPQYCPWDFDANSKKSGFAILRVQQTLAGRGPERTYQCADIYGVDCCSGVTECDESPHELTADCVKAVRPTCTIKQHRSIGASDYCYNEDLRRFEVPLDQFGDQWIIPKGGRFTFSLGGISTQTLLADYSYLDQDGNLVIGDPPEADDDDDDVDDDVDADADADGDEGITDPAIPTTTPTTTTPTTTTPTTTTPTTTTPTTTTTTTTTSPVSIKKCKKNQLVGIFSAQEGVACGHLDPDEVNSLHPTDRSDFTFYFPHEVRANENKKLIFAIDPTDDPLCGPSPVEQQAKPEFSVYREFKSDMDLETINEWLAN